MAEPLPARLPIALLHLPRIGRKTTAKLLVALGDFSPSTDYELCDSLNQLRNAGMRVPSVTEADAEVAFSAADEILSLCADTDIKVLTPGDGRLPAHFWSAPDPPVVVYLRGNEIQFGMACVAIIGTRQPTSYGLKSAERFASRCAEAGLVVVSGLAIGCDAAAHLGCLEAGGQTVAVMAHGLDRVHPASNRDLAARIVDEGGCLISEYPPGTDPRPNYFVERDRLQSALSHGVVVVETDVKGGTMHTVGFAKEQGRLLACLSHPEQWKGEAKAQGNQKLIADGLAFPLGDSDDLVAFIEQLRASSQSVISLPRDETSKQASLWD